MNRDDKSIQVTGLTDHSFVAGLVTKAARCQHRLYFRALELSHARAQTQLQRGLGVLRVLGVLKSLTQKSVRKSNVTDVTLF